MSGEHATMAYWRMHLCPRHARMVEEGLPYVGIQKNPPNGSVVTTAGAFRNSLDIRFPELGDESIVTRPCPVDGTPVPQRPGSGRQRMYCSDRCRQRAHRASR